MKILHIEDCREDAELVHALLLDEWPDCEVKVASNKHQLFEQLGSNTFDLVLSDFSLGPFNGLDALKVIKDKSPEMPFIFLSGTIGEERAIDAVRDGYAQDYVLKDRMKRLITAIHRALRDSNERRQREMAAQRIREQAELLNKARDAIIVTDLEGIITFWNKGAERVCGWTARDVVGRRLDHILGTGAYAGIEMARKALEEKDEWRGEFHIHDRQGKLLVMEISASLIRDDRGQPKARLCIGTDVTAKKNLEEQFLRVQRLESIGMLASGIAHDLNNVLAPIFLAAPLLREHATNPVDLRMITTLEKSAERGAGLVRQILAFAHGVGGEHQLVQVKHLLRDTLSVINETFPKDIKAEEKIHADLWPIMANPTQIHQVLLNLCVNARDAMPHGGRLLLRAENCFLDAQAAKGIEGASAGAWLVLHVEDSGTGIPPETLARIWEPFFTTKGIGKGTGLGLSTVRGIVENHKGFINLKTRVGQGTAFRVYLPASGATSGRDNADTVAPFAARGEGELVLVADDETTILEITSTILSQNGYKVIVARDGTEAVALFAKRCDEISLVISDLSMPNLGGAELSKVLHRLNPNVKILTMSGLNDGSVKESQMERFTGAFLIKPFKPQILLQAVQSMLHAPGARN
jgi:two-component system, cell cycle sensor histidine kinase and response regulator CckA